MTIDELGAIANSVRGTFQTAETMAQSFLREAILKGVYKPGQRLNQDAIAEVLGVSRMPVRASLRKLEAEGLVRLTPHRGATVSVLRRHQIAEVYELRILIECHLMELAVAKLTDQDITDIEQLIGKVDASPQSDGPERRRELYEHLYEHADRPRALAMVKQLRDSLGRYLLLIQADDIQHHEELLEHLRMRDTVAAKRWLTAHLQHISKLLQAVVPDDDDDPSGATDNPGDG